MKTLAIIGAGKGLGLSIAKRFGREGFQVALVARTESKLQEMVKELEAEGIPSFYVTADLYDEQQIIQAIHEIQTRYGQIDVLEFSPIPGKFPPTHVLELTVDNVNNQLDGYIPSAITIVRTVLPDMLNRKQGALLFTTGLSALYPIPFLGNVGIAMAGLRNYITNLHTELQSQGIYVSHRSLGLMIKEAGSGGFGDPDVIADMWYRNYEDQQVWEEEYPKGVTPDQIIFD